MPIMAVEEIHVGRTTVASWRPREMVSEFHGSAGRATFDLAATLSSTSNDTEAYMKK